MSEHYSHIGKDVLLMFETEPLSIDRYQFTAVGNTLAEITDGEGSISIDGRSFDVNGHCLVAYLDGQNVAPHVLNTKGRSITFSTHFTEEVCHDTLEYHNVFPSVIVHPVVSMDAPLMRSLNIFIRGLEDIASRVTDVRSTLSAEYLAKSFALGPIFRLFKPFNPSLGTSRSPELASRFLKLVKEHFRTHRDIGFYADRMCITRRYLGMSVLSSMGMSPEDVIGYRLLGESEYMLGIPDYSITQICENLRFSSLQSFDKFFHKKTGLSPLGYRRSLMR